VIIINSILRYPGGKSRAIKYLKDYFPKDLDILVSPFFGGGSLEIYLSKQGVKIYGYDIFKPLVNFWKSLKYDKEKLIEEVKKLN
jgi:DNA adenine methylase